LNQVRVTSKFDTWLHKEGLAGVSGMVLLALNRRRSLAGVTVTGSSAALIATWTQYEQPCPAAEYVRTWLHEAGHNLGLTARDSRTFYEGAGHFGPHCFAGIGKQASYMPSAGARRESIKALIAHLKKATCLMFGSIEGSGTTFCPECAKAGRRAPARWPAAAHV
jgi:hypothetical protein